MLGISKTSVSNLEHLTTRLTSGPGNNNLVLHNYPNDTHWLYSSELSTTPDDTQFYFEDDEWIMLFDGDLIKYHQTPWSYFRDILHNDTFDDLSELVGIWALAAINKKSGDIYLVSDRLSEYPFFYSVLDGTLNFSTELYVFCRLTKLSKFNLKWLHDSLFLQFPVGDKTFLEEVYRLPAASVLIFNNSKNTLTTHKYCEDFTVNTQLKTDGEAFEYALNIFNSQLTDYLPNDIESAIGLTAGLDARTVLAFTIGSKPLTYTYGRPDCNDITTAKKAADYLDLSHKVIPYDTKLQSSYKDLILDVVHLSGGLENSSRASVLYAYREITENGTKYPLIISGIGLDSLFRGHLGPALVSPGLASYFRGNGDIGTPSLLNDIIIDTKKFTADKNSSLEYLKNRYGDFENSLSHLLYFVYEAAPKYFGGEVSIARHFTKLRIPGLNQHIIKLAFSIDKSALSYSNFLATHNRDSFCEKQLQCYLLSKASNGKLGNLPVYDVAPVFFQYGELVCKTIKKFTSLKRFAARIILGVKRPPPLENNIDFYKSTAKNRVLELLYSDETLIKQYVNVPDFRTLVSTDHQHIFKVLLTTEIILRLIKSRWEPFW